MSMPLSTRAIFATSEPFTAMPNALLDWVQPRLSLSAWSVLCVIVRRTRGWHKKYDALSYEQLKAATGIKSTATISKALTELLSDSPFGKPLLRRQKSPERSASCREATRYALNPRFEIEAGASSTEEENGSEREIPSPIQPSENEEPQAVHASFIEAPPPVRPSETEDTKEPPISYKVKNSECEHARASPTAYQFKSQNSSPNTLLASVCAATLRDPAIVSTKMKSQLIACAHKLQRAGYRPEQIELAASRWPYPTAPHPSQLLDNIAALLSARPVSDSPSRRATPSNPAASLAPCTARNDGGTPASRPRFESTAARKSRCWAQWLADIGQE